MWVRCPLNSFRNWVIINIAYPRLVKIEDNPFRSYKEIIINFFITVNIVKLK